MNSSCNRWVILLGLSVGIGAARMTAQVVNMSHDLISLGIATRNLAPNTPSLDARPLIQATIQYAQRHSVQKLTVDTGSYYLQSNMQSNSVLIFPALSNLTVDLAGSVLYFMGPMLPNGIQVYQCTNFTLTNFSTDFINPPYTHVQISSVDTRNRLLMYRTIPGWPDPTTFNGLTSPAGDRVMFWAAIFRNGSVVPGTTRTQLTAPFAGGTLALAQDYTPWTQSAALATLQAGDTIVVTARGSGAPLIVWDSDSVTLSNIHIYGSPTWAIQIHATSNSTVDNVSVQPRPNGGLVGSNADGIHFDSVRQNDHIVNCFVSGTMDDALAMDALDIGTVVSQSGPRQVTVTRGGFLRFPNGTAVNFVDPVTTLESTGGTIVSQSPADTAIPPYNGQVVITFDRDLPSLPAGTGMVYASPQMRGQGSTIANNTVDSTYGGRGVWLGGVQGVTIEHNTLLRTSLSGIGALQDTESYPGPPVHDVVITGNTLETDLGPAAAGTGIQNALAAIMVQSTNNQNFAFATSPSNTNVSIDGNYIGDSGRSGVWVGELNGGTIENNAVVRNSQNPTLGGLYGIQSQFCTQVSQDSLLPIVVRYSTGVSQSANTSSAAALSVAVNHAASFSQSQQGAVYVVTVSNASAAGSTSGTVTVSESLPAAFTLVSISGNGWTCSNNTASCLRSDPLAAGSSYPAITVAVNVSGGASSPQVSSTSVSGGGAAATSCSDSIVVASGTPVTVQTSPTGLQFTVDGGPAQHAPATVNLALGAHTIAVAATQAGTTGTQYAFASWSDGLGASHSITVGSNAATYTATFQTQYQLMIAVSPATAGSISPGTGGFYNAGTSISLSAVPNDGFQFSGWTGSVANASNAATSITMSAPEIITANFSSTGGITIQTIPAGLQFGVDGGPPQTAPKVLNLSQGAHAISVAALQSGGAGTQYVFRSWSDGGMAAHSIAIGASSAVYTATFTTQYQLTVATSPPAGGVATPSSGAFYDAATVVPIQTAAYGGYIFTGWTGDVSAPSSLSATVTMSRPETVTANFTKGQAPPAVTDLSPAPGTTVVPPTANLSWVATPGAASYDVYFGTSTPPPLAQADLTATSFSPALTAGVTYYWAIAAKNAYGSTLSAVSSFTTSLPATGLRFVPVKPCRVIDTRSTTGASLMPGGTRLDVPIIQSACGIPVAAQAYSLNVTVVPSGPLAYLSIWPKGAPQTAVSTLNSPNGRIVANAAIVPAGAGGQISVYASDATDVILDINGYFVPAAPAGGLSFYAAIPCRIADTRNAIGAFGGPSLRGGSPRSFVIPASSCGLPSTAQAYSLNITAVPRGVLGYLTIWPAGQSQPLASTLNSSGGTVTNAAIVPAGTGGAVTILATDDTDVIIDISGYFAPPGGANELSFYTLQPCRVADTRTSAGAFGGPGLAANSVRSFTIPASACNVPVTAQAYSLNLTVCPQGPLAYLTDWPYGQPQPSVSTLVSPGGAIVANAAIVTAGAAGAISIFVPNPTNVILDINGYFAP
ncbi:MAG TPA: right-handed parallel beta-helix repeat-containing protein [Bryobacteraceae bacterium]|nr:right-handed parallel beta-helix repeat-containing protein [Bryobacteraceae bacterium]